MFEDELVFEEEQVFQEEVVFEVIVEGGRLTEGTGLEGRVVVCALFLFLSTLPYTAAF